MIRTHRPRGHAWNCASVFQQTKLFRHIDLNECEPPQDQILGADPRNGWDVTERRAKRQRIEKLADDFLNGSQLHIHSARLDPQRLKAALTLSLARPRDAKAAVEEIHVQEKSDAVWEDVDDDREVLKALASARRSGNGDGTTAVENDVPVSGEIAIIEAQASCGPKRRLRSGKVIAGPSEEALRKAAELRNRRFRPSGVDVAHESQIQSCLRPVVPETQDLPTESSIVDSASDCGPTPTPGWTSSKWLQSGAFQLPKKSVDEDCSKDELGATSIFAPSQRSRTRTRPLTRTASASNRSTSSDLHDSCTLQETVTQGTSASIPSAALIPETSHPSRAVSLTQDESMSCKQPGPTAEDNSQTELLHRQGLHVAPRKSWVAVNESSMARGESDQGDGYSTGHAADLVEEPAQIVRKASKGRSTKSTGNTQSVKDAEQSTRRRSAPSESQRQVEVDATLPTNPRVDALRDGAQYNSIAVGGASPFVYRKRTTNSNGNTPEVESVKPPPHQPSKTPRRKMVFPSSDSPRLNVLAPHTPLADEHLNKILPKDATSGPRSSAARRALREELRASGAEISRCADDPSSSQGEPAAEHEHQEATSAEDSTTLREYVASPEPMPVQNFEYQPAWPGTQDQLAQAYKNLFSSPDKTDTTLYLGEKGTPGTAMGPDGDTKSGRRPLKQLSQEPIPMPSTQALLDGWEGWSTIKKPRSGGKRSSLVQSPTMGKGAVISSDPGQSLNAADRRRSSLRYSMPTYESPGKTPAKDINSLPTPRLDAPQPVQQSLGSMKSATRRSTGGAPSSLCFGFSTLDLPTAAPQPKETGHLSKTLEDLSFGQTMSSIQPPQRQPEPDCYSQDLDLTITQIADNILTTGVESFTTSEHGNGTFSF
ncbi:hypothetical protein M409DRAFT_58091 [Zasmidium cellare ATCC 36951]|uniref:Uncharacterized protein n=1 Tax=Zasmidium cellare ATCC 36951 TaxID=1080233 RepID=A0A6A6C678_ZASCE|nr:uncharacterized protein M409DRAFT_58091 [Zasmidium cellare ATCC 36951]KAF2162677.1 hypothetical protein M409DRAFT_58091 [Zasmidium cellare ATCC 36951]